MPLQSGSSPVNLRSIGCKKRKVTSYKLIIHNISRILYAQVTNEILIPAFGEQLLQQQKEKITSSWSALPYQKRKKISTSPTNTNVSKAINWIIVLQKIK